MTQSSIKRKYSRCFVWFVGKWSDYDREHEPEQEQEKLSLIQSPSRIKRFALCPIRQGRPVVNCCALTAPRLQRRRLSCVRVGARPATNVSER